LTITTFH